jgi:hypothetical protein
LERTAERRFPIASAGNSLAIPSGTQKRGDKGGGRLIVDLLVLLVLRRLLCVRVVAVATLSNTRGACLGRDVWRARIAAGIGGL